MCPPGSGRGPGRAGPTGPNTGLRRLCPLEVSKSPSQAVRPRLWDIYLAWTITPTISQGALPSVSDERLKGDMPALQY